MLCVGKYILLFENKNYGQTSILSAMKAKQKEELLTTFHWQTDVQLLPRK